MIAASIARSIRLDVDVGGNYPAGLHAHIVQGGRDSARSDGIGVARVPAYLDRVCYREKRVSGWVQGYGRVGLTVWIAQQRGNDDPRQPLIDAIDVDQVHKYQERQGPYLSQ